MTRVSIIVPICDEEQHIAQCIDSIVAQSYPKNLLRVILVDGMSVDGTRHIVKDYCDKYGFIRLINNPNKIVPSALNIGIREAEGDIVVRMDAHTYYDKDYVQKCVETLDKVDAVNVGGPIKTLPGSGTSIAKAISLATSNPFGVGNSKFRTADKAQYVDTVAFGAFRKNVFEKIGLFNEKLIRNQDIEFNSRIIQAGEKIYLNPEIKSYYYNQSTLKGLWKQNFGNGVWNVFTLSINRRALSKRHFVPFAFVLSLLGSLIFASIYQFFLFILGFIFVLYLITNTFFSVKIALKHHLKLVLVLPVVFATLHFSYGLGYLWGFLRLKHFRANHERSPNAPKFHSLSR